jgi:hypothetical protein
MLLTSPLSVTNFSPLFVSRAGSRTGADGKQDPAILQGMLDAAAAARTAEARGKGVGVFPLFPRTEEQARAGGQHFFEGWEYYCTDRSTLARPSLPLGTAWTASRPSTRSASSI